MTSSFSRQDGFIEAQQVSAEGENSGVIQNGNINHQQDEENGTTNGSSGGNFNWLEMGAGAAAGLGLLGLYLANR